MKLWIYGYSIYAYFGKFVTLFIFGDTYWSSLCHHFLFNSNLISKFKGE